MRRGSAASFGAVLLVLATCVSIPAAAPAYTAETPSPVICLAGREARVLVLEHNREPAEGAQEPVGPPLTFSSSEAPTDGVGLTFTISASPSLTPSIDGAQIAPDATGHVAFTSAVSASIARTIYWNISYSFSGGEGCPLETVTLATRSLSVAVPEPISLPWTTPPSPRRKPEQCDVPRLRGSSLRHARALLEREGCRLGRIKRRRAHGGRAVVTAQSPQAGAVRAVGSAVNVTLLAPPRRAS